MGGLDMKMRSKAILFLSVLSLAAACSDQKKEEGRISDAQVDMVSADSILAEVDTASSSNPFNLREESDPSRISFRTSRDTLYRGDTLVLTFTSDSLLEMAIVRPDNDFFLLVGDQEENSKPMLSKDALRTRKKLTLITNKATAYSRTAETNKKIFNQTGVYKFRLSKNLRNEVGYLETAKVYFINEKR
ncbi:MAG TPA: hypothetical protein VK927_04320 [Adhaeribacter sp.]|nr:hypothetical protein [Adhaeribacter sp.]